MWEIVELVSLVLVKSPKYHKRLSDKQVQLLKVLFKFRFVSTDLVSSLLGKDRSTIYESLYNLEKQKLIHKFHDKTYRLRGKPAVYCLAAEGIKYLRNNTELDQTTLRNYYKNKTADEQLIDNYLNVFAIYLKLTELVGSRFHVYTRPEMVREAFIKPLPVLYLARKRKAEDKLGYVLDIFPAGTPRWLLVKRLRAWQEFEDETEYSLCNVLLLAQNQSAEKRLIRLTDGTIQGFDWFTSQQELFMDSSDGKVWVDVMNFDEDGIVRIKLG